MIEREFTAGAPVRGQVKDLRTAVETASGLDLPLTELALSLYEDLAAAGGSELDHSALLLELERREGSGASSDQGAA